MDGETPESLEQIKAGILALAEPKREPDAIRTAADLHAMMIAADARFAGLTPLDAVELRARDAIQPAAEAHAIDLATVEPVIAPLIERLRQYAQANDYLRDCDQDSGRRAGEFRKERDKAVADLTAVYRERAHLVALLAALYPSGWAIDPMEPNPMDWRIVYVQTPAGQLSWHIAAADWELFAHVPENPAVEWDGHSTDEKYERIRKLTGETEPFPLIWPERIIHTETKVTWSVDFQHADGKWMSPAWDLPTRQDAERARDKCAPRDRGKPWRIVKTTNAGTSEVVSTSDKASSV